MPIYKMQGKKNGLQKYRVRINFVDGYGKSKQLDRVAYGLEEAKELERKLLQGIKDEGTSPRRMTVRALYEAYIEAKRHEVRATTLEKNIRNLNLYVLPTLGDVRIDKLTTPLLQDWKQAINNHDPKYGLRTRQNFYSELRALLNFAVKMEYLSVNPILRVGNFKDAYDEREEMRFYTPDEFLEYIAQAHRIAKNSREPIAWDYYVFFCIAFYTGLRKGEIHALRWSAIDGNILHVRRSLTQKLKGDDQETPPKNKASIRSLQIPTPLLEILSEHRVRWAAAHAFTPDFKVCGGTRALRDTTIADRNILFALLGGVPVIRIHDFRHTHASVLINEGINIQEIARRLGHANIKETLDTYAHLYPREEEKAVDILNRIRE